MATEKIGTMQLFDEDGCLVIPAVDRAELRRIELEALERAVSNPSPYLRWAMKAEK